MLGRSRITVIMMATMVAVNQAWTIVGSHLAIVSVAKDVQPLPPILFGVFWLFIAAGGLSGMLALQILGWSAIGRGSRLLGVGLLAAGVIFGGGTLLGLFCWLKSVAQGWIV
jgi:hypothetical protein